MESLSDTIWDVVLSGTGLPQSLLALALSRSGKQVLHVDKNDYYGGSEAAFSLEEVESWAGSSSQGNASSSFRHASIDKPEKGIDSPKLGFSRAYSLTLSPQLIYTRSNLLPALVSSKVAPQLDFLAAGSWFCYDNELENEEAKNELNDVEQKDRPRRLYKIPGGREDVFADKSIDLRSARSLMKFLKTAADQESQSTSLEGWGSRPFPEFLSSKYKLSSKLQRPLIALTLSPKSPAETSTELALYRIHRHLTSMGVFGPGFGAVIPKWGGLAEVAQVACRAGAVGGGVYVLNRGIDKIESLGAKDAVEQNESKTKISEELLSVHLNDGEIVRTKFVIGTPDNLPLRTETPANDQETIYVDRSISIISSPLQELFPVSVDGAPSPSCAVVMFPASSLDNQGDISSLNHGPIYLAIHSSDTGECPSGQFSGEYIGVIYGFHQPSSSSTHTPQSISTHAESIPILKYAISTLLTLLPPASETTPPSSNLPQKLWELTFQSLAPPPSYPETNSLGDVRRIITLSPVPPTLVLEDDVLRSVRAVWENVMAGLEGDVGKGAGAGDETGSGFMQFPDRAGEQDLEDDVDVDDDNDEGERLDNDHQGEEENTSIKEREVS